MAYNSVHNLDAMHITAYSPSVGTTPVVAYVDTPVKGRLISFSGILRGAITTADGTITVTNVTTGVTIGTFTVTQSGSAAGLRFAGTPTTFASSLVSQNDVISITPSAASGASIGMDFKLVFRTF